MGFVNARVGVAIIRATHLCIQGSRVTYRHVSTKRCQGGWRGSGGRPMCVCGCRGLIVVVVVTYYDFRFVTYTIGTHCLYHESTTFVSHLIVAVHHQAALFALECVFDRKSTPTPITPFLQIFSFQPVSHSHSISPLILRQGKAVVVGGLNGYPCAGLFIPACVVGVDGGYGRADGVEGGTCNGGTRGAHISSSLPHRCLVVPHAQGGIR